MFTFLLVTYLAATASAATISGYNYKQQNSPSFSPVSNTGIYSNQQSPPLTSFSGNSGTVAPSVPQLYAPPALQVAGLVPPYIGQVQQSVSYAPPAGVAPSFHITQPTHTQQQVNLGVTNLVHQTLHQQNQQHVQHQQNQQQHTIISKDIYIHSAPEEVEEIGHDLSSEAGPVHKNYRIVFIKAPSHNIKFNTQYVKQKQALNEEKTVIYVLSKKPDIAQIHTELSSLQATGKPSKPEVYFIKYKTPEEANRAQQEIQAQYDSLGGSTHISDEGIAPVASVIGGVNVKTGSVDLALSSNNFFKDSNVQQEANDSQQNFLPESFQRSASSTRLKVKRSQ